MKRPNGKDMFFSQRPNPLRLYGHQLSVFKSQRSTAMTRILIFSDSHGRVEQMKRVIHSIPDVSTVLFLGDVLSDIQVVQRDCPNLTFYSVPGNNDFGSSLPLERVVTIDDIRLFLAHGHQHQVKFTADRIIYRARELACDVCLFGHTHRAVNVREGRLLLLNPGSVSLPYGGKPSYGILEIDGGKVGADIIYLS